MRCSSRFLAVALGVLLGSSGARIEADPALRGGAGGPQESGPGARVRPALRVGSLPDDLVLDGVLDEPAWREAEAIENLTMIEPVEGGVPTGRTVVRVLASRRELVIGVRAFDPAPGGIVSYTVERDGSLRGEDHVRIVLDTFDDGRSGYVFAVNPSGARYDALVARRGESENRSWDGIWEAETSRDDEGWSAEIRIPLTTLAFKKDLHRWLFNVERRIQRLLEIDRWAGASRDYSLTQTIQGGHLVDLPAFDFGLGLSVTPSLVGRHGRISPEEGRNLEGDVSLDTTQRLGPNLLASLTFHTDFAETEVDVRRSNLTRFPLFYPEKRTFFLEGSDAFDFGLGLGRDVIPFHSRRIGLVSGVEVPLLAGAKLSGKMGRTSLGALLVGTDEVAGTAPATEMGVLRLRRDVGDESTAGLIVTTGDPLGREGSWMAGGDFTFQTSEFREGKNLLAGVWGLATDREDLSGGSRSAIGAKLDYPNDLWDVSFTYKRIGEDFDPSLGFVPRRGIRQYRLGIDYTPHPDWRFVRQMFYEFSATYITDLEGNPESYRVFTAPLNWNLESGDAIEFNVLRQGENLSAPFEIADGVVIEPGNYQWTRFRIQAGGASKRPLSGEVAWWFGPFYDGTLDTLELSLDWNPVPLLTLEGWAERNAGRLEGGDFTEDVLGSRVRLNVSPDLTLSTLAQYDSEGRSAGANVRLQWTLTPASTLDVVYNENWNRTAGSFLPQSYETVAKIQYTFLF